MRLSYHPRHYILLPVVHQSQQKCTEGRIRHRPWIHPPAGLAAAVLFVGTDLVVVLLLTGVRATGADIQWLIYVIAMYIY